VTAPVSNPGRSAALLWGAALSTAAVAAALLSYGPTLGGAQAAARWTARVAFAFFALAFAGPGLQVLLARPWTRTLAEREWPLTLGFIGAHLVHFAALAVYQVLAAVEPNPVRLAGGALAYLLVFVVLLRPATRAWAFYYLWFVFFMTYLPRVTGSHPGPGGDPRAFPFLLALVVVLLLVRLAAQTRTLTLKES